MRLEISHSQEAQVREGIAVTNQTEGVPDRRKMKSKIPGLPSEPMSAEDAVIVDRAPAIVLAARKERSERIFGA